MIRLVAQGLVNGHENTYSKGPQNSKWFWPEIGKTCVSKGIEVKVSYKNLLVSMLEKALEAVRRTE